MPRVSVITALFNHEAFLSQAIESVLGQSYTDWEYLIWDDGSTDKSLSIARQYESRSQGKIRVFTHSGGRNLGQENTRNAALDKASGELLCILDSDDFYTSHKLKVLVPCFDDPKVGLAYGRAEFFDESTGARRLAKVNAHPEGEVFEELVYENFLCAGATMFRRECVSSGLRFDSRFRTMGEYPLWLKIARDWRFAAVPEVVAAWRNHGDNLGTRLSLQAKQELVQLCESLKGDSEYSRYSRAISKALAKKRYDYANELYRGLALEAAREQLGLACQEPGVSLGLRMKSKVLSAATLLGPSVNQYLSKAKRAFWERRRLR